MLKCSTRLLIVPLLVLCYSLNVLAQERTITGKVSSSDDGLALPGVNVLVRGTSAGTITDSDGNYSIRVPGESAVLVFSYVGYTTQEIAVSSNSVINVVLVMDSKRLGEVVVTAFGLEQQKKTLTFSVQEVSSKEILQSRETNIVDALNAKVAGVQVTRQGGSAGGAASITIRGSSSISGENQPLFVVDGIPINNSFRTFSRSSSVDVSNRAIDINPNDIESITVLKGPAATALYGLQAGSGVVIITTKKGAKQDGRNVRVDLSSNFSVDRIINYFPAQMLYAQGDNGVFGNPTFSHFGPPITTLRYDGTNLNPLDPKGRIVDMNDPSAIGSATITPVDNQKAFFQNGTTFDNNISISGSTAKGNHLLSIGNYAQKGIIPNNTFDRASIRLTSDNMIRDDLRLVGSANYVNSKGTRFGRGDNFSDAVQGTFRTPPSFDNTLGYVLPNGHQRSFNYNINNPDAGSPDNPFWTVNNNPFNDNVHRIIGYVQAFYDPLSWVNIMYRVGTDVTSDNRKQIWAKGSTGGDGRFGRVVEDNFIDRSINSDLLVTFKKKIGEDFDFSLLVGHNYFDNYAQRLYVTGSNLAIPGLYNISNATTDLQQIQNLSRKRTAAALSRLNVDYKGFLLAEFTARNEWTSTLLKGNNSFLYGSAGLGFVFTDAFEIDNTILSFGKVRASIASSGRDASPYLTDTYYARGSVGGAWGGGLVFPVPGSGIGGVELSNVSGNPKLKPERNLTYEIGADVSFIGDRVKIEATWFQSANSDQIIAVNSPGSTGFTSQWTNIGTITNKGIEAIINANPVSSGGFSWNITMNFTRIRNEVSDLPVERILMGGFGNLRPSLINGEPYSVFYGTAFKRDAATGQLLLTDAGLPQLDPTGDKKIGDPNPDWLMGLRNTLNYKNFSLSFLFDIRKGGDVANVTANWMVNQGVPSFTAGDNRGVAVVFKGLKESDMTPNATPVILNQAYYTSNAGNRNIAERFIEDGSWVRLRDISLSYTVPSPIVSKIGARNASVSLYGRNLLLFTAYRGVDPETNLYGPNSSLGVDAFGTPNTKSVGMSLNLTF
jgi:TonB-linked SusC/RagA family outer membrane protein